MKGREGNIFSGRGGHECMTWTISSDLVRSFEEHPEMATWKDGEGKNGNVKNVENRPHEVSERQICVRDKLTLIIIHSRGFGLRGRSDAMKS